ncbi:PKD domain-containing protein [Actinospica sp. MGRD01-02]|uniref:PKD domain-containing protein n=1 Tax=Actinospica acidithermotolerans TaxID=2828514 RepID=A0A941IGK3_9ACTN|nr:PKD domain-containing protein [Actinospica acidithermotolerans]MBR7824742.1 PKD domain-containing protein [Actinospica acidithermotolerans]
MYRRRFAAVTALALITASTSPVVAHAASGPTTYYVAQVAACTDLGPGTAAEPFCTVQQAASAATVPGDTVKIEVGSYNDEVDITASGTAAAPITFEAATNPTPYSYTVGLSGGLVIKGASYVNVSGVSTTDAQIENSSHVTLSSGELTTKSISTPVVAVTGTSSDVTLSKLLVYGSAIDIDASGTGNAVTSSLLTEYSSPGIIVDGSANAVLTSNTVNGYCGTGISIGDDGNGTASGATIENNVVAEAATSANPSIHGSCSAASAVGLSMQSTADTAGVTADYNSIYPDLSTASSVYDWAGNAYSTPASFEAATGQGAHDSVADPVINAGGSISGESSPLINSANANAPDEQSTDLFDRTRVADPNVAETGAGTAGYDRGALQFVEVLGMYSPSTVATAPSGAAVTVTAYAAKSNWAGATFTYEYDFGDGSKTTSSSLTESHPYTSASTYTVTVTAISDYGATYSTQTSIQILAPVAFSASITSAPTYGTMTDTAVTVHTDWPITSATMKFGDGKTPQDLTLSTSGSTSTDTVYYSYAKPGTYTVSFTVADAGGDQQTITKTITTKGTDFTAYGPTRLLDTRKSLGGTSSQLLHDGSIKLKIAGSGSIPANVTAVALNLTIVNANGGGYIQADTGTDNGTSTVNYNTGPVYSNAVIAQVASDGTVTLRNFGATTAVKLDLIADVTGYFAPTAGSAYDFVTPARLMDTRKGIGTAKAKLAAGKTDVLTVEGVSSLPSSGVTAVSVNITEVNTTGSGYLIAYPDETTLPNSSTVDWNGATTKAAGAIVPVGADGKIDIHNGGGGTAAADVIVDVTGYFTSTGSGDVYVPVTSDRVLDTRKSGPGIAPGTATSLNLTGKDGMPGEFQNGVVGSVFVDGYVLNATVTQTPADGYLLVSGSQTPDGTSTVNWTGVDQTSANIAFTQAQSTSASDGGEDSDVWFYNTATKGHVQTIADVMGYFTAG